MAGGNASFVKRGGRFANCTTLSVAGRRLALALADMRAILGHRRLWLTCALLVGLFTLTGPFDTLQRLPTPHRLAYWSAVLLAGWTVAAAHVALAMRFLPALLPETLRATIGGAATAPCMVHGVGLLNETVFGTSFASLTDSPLRMALFAGVAASVTLLSRLVAPVSADRPSVGTVAARPTPAAPAPRPPSPSAGAAPAAAPPPGPPRILMRLPPAKRGALLRLSMQDHYVEIVTAAGSALSLLRLSDAMTEAAPTQGLQVHRSHWVAEGAVTGARRENGRLLLELVDGAEIPVSRGRVQAVRDAGWILPPSQRRGGIA